jgi:hypothetical protein
LSRIWQRFSILFVNQIKLCWLILIFPYCTS